MVEDIRGTKITARTLFIQRERKKTTYFTAETGNISDCEINLETVFAVGVWAVD